MFKMPHKILTKNKNNISNINKSNIRDYTLSLMLTKHGYVEQKNTK